MFFHSPPSPLPPVVPEGPTFLPCLEEVHNRKEQLLDQETGQASIQIEVPSSKRAKSPLDDDSSGSLFKENVAEIPVSECFYVNQVPMASQTGMASQTSKTGQPGKEITEAQSGVVSQTGTVSIAEMFTLFESEDSMPPIMYASNRSLTDHTPHSSQMSGHTEQSTPNQPPPRPTFLPPSSCSPPPIPPSPPLNIQTSPNRRVIKGSGTVQFAGMSSAISTRQSGERGGAGGGSSGTRKRKFFRFGSRKNEPNSDPPLVSVCPEDRKNLLDEISSMGNAILKKTNRPRSPGGTPVKVTPSNQAVAEDNSDVLQRALLTKFRSLHSTPLNQSRFLQQGYSTSLDFSNAWSEFNASLAFEDPEISASPVSGYTPNETRNGSRKMTSAHNGSTAV